MSRRRLGALMAGLVLLAAGCGAPPTGPIAAPVAANDQASVFVEPDDGLEPLLNELRGAAKSIDMEMYLLTDREVMAAMEDAERRGVRVRAMLEQHPYGEGAGNESAYTTLQRAGIAIRWTDPRFKLTHEKTVIVDGREALILTLNLTASAFTRNREYGVIDRTPGDVAEASAIFDADWNRAAYAPAQPDLVVSPDNSRVKLLALIGQAASRLDLESEEVQDDGLEQALAQAHSRGVSVRFVLSPAAAGQPDANAAGIKRLQAGGVQVRFMSKPYVHAKIAVADRRTAFVGSENVSRQSLDGNRELGLFLSQADAVSRIEATFEQDWGSHS